MTPPPGGAPAAIAGKPFALRAQAFPSTAAAWPPTGRSVNINTNNNRRQVGPLQTATPGPLQAAAPRQNGSLIHPQTFSSMFRGLVKAAGLRRIRLHDLRHTHATLALQAGVPVTIISERLGHHSPGFTLRQYAHALPGMQAPAAAVVAEMLHDEALAIDDARDTRGQLPAERRRVADRGSEYHRLISLFLSCVEQTAPIRPRPTDQREAPS